MKQFAKQYEMIVNKAKEDNKQFLFSFTEIVQLHNPLEFYSSISQFTNGEHFFWKDPQNEMILLGYGCTHLIQTDLTDDRFQFIEDEWNKIIDFAYIYDTFNEIGIGPILFGGFTFDPTHEKDKEWEDFSNANFFLPEIMLTIKEKNCFLTVNIMINPNHDTAEFGHLERMKTKIFNDIKESIKAEPTEIMREEINPIQWKDSVKKVIGLLRNGDLDKVVLARKMKMKYNIPISPDVIMKHLLEQQQSSYLFSFGYMNHYFTGASPERLVKKVENTILSTCLAGSIKRNNDDEEDQRLGDILMNDKKNRHEHQFVVSMINEVFQKYCTHVEIPSNPILLKTPDIQHLYTPVKGIVKESTSILKLVQSLHPTPALGGTPKEDALLVIRDVEKMDRGLYAGPIGWMDYRGNGEFIVAIRSGLIKDTEAFIYAGCGIVADSNPEDEYLETKMKFRPMLRALGGKEE